MKRLILFTSSYPYSTAETFLEDEIVYLCGKFSHVTIIPITGYETPKRSVPGNCEVFEPIIKGKIEKTLLGLYNRYTIIPYLKDFIRNKVLFSKRKLKVWLASYFNTNIILNTSYTKRILKDIDHCDICYFYWGVGGNSISYFLKDKAKFVSRFHGEWDLWEESSDGYAVLRPKILESLDMKICISERGKKYLERKYDSKNVIVSRLGSPDLSIGKKSTDNILRVVTCSSVYPLKRVPLIFDALNKYTQKQIEWTHFGGGQDLKKITEYVMRNAGSHIKVFLKGQVSHNEVLRYYQTNPVDIFINASTNEGIPVSIMEAISFDIPIVATNVGSTAEVVTAETGVLLNPNPTSEEICKAIDVVLNSNLHPRDFWKKHYNASVNYSQFADILYNL